VSVIATAVRHLMAAGVTGEALLSAIADMEAEIRAEPKARSTAAVRQERYRRNKASQTVTSDAPLPLPPNENISNPPILAVIAWCLRLGDILASRVWFGSPPALWRDWPSRLATQLRGVDWPF